MATNEKLILVNVNLNGNEARNVVVQNLAADPATGKAGQIYYNSTSNKLRQYNGTAWKNVGDVESVNVKADEKIITVDNTDAANPKISSKISATQGTGVTVTGESDGLKVAIQDGDTTKKGIVQLLTPTTIAAYNDETKAITSKGATVVLDSTITPTTGYLKSYELKQGGLSLGKIDIPKDFLVKAAKIKTTTAYAVNTAYEVDDLIINTSKLYRVKTAISASDNTDFSKVDTVEVTDITSPTVGMTIMMFIINVKSGTADNEYLYINIAALAQSYSADEVSLTKSASNVFSLKNDGLTPVTKLSSHKVKIDKFGLISEIGDEIKTHHRATGTIAVGSKTASIELPKNAELVSYRTTISGQEVVTDVTITEATAAAVGSVAFSIVDNATSAIDCVVVYAAPEA